MASLSHLAKLNTEQRQAVEQGGPAYADAGPLLIIAGAGSGKTDTLAHRVTHLILNGIDPRRILLLTFSRRAATEMTRRVERIAAQVLGDKAGADRRAELVRYFSCNRSPPSARVRAASRARPGFHDP